MYFLFYFVHIKHEGQDTGLIFYLIIAVIVASFHFGPAEAATGNEAKVTSPGGYAHLQSQSRDVISIEEDIPVP